MPEGKTPLTIDEHIDFGGHLQHLRADLTGALRLVLAHYPKTSRQARAAREALNSIDELRAALDSASCRELPGEKWSPLIYFGANAEEREAWMARRNVDA
jgi:hypothetical protein